MANDITTLAIEIQSQEAERNLRTFNELLSLSSKTAQKMEKVSIEIDVTGALAQLNALRENYTACAKAAESMTFDMPQVASPEVDTTALDELKEFFAQSLASSKELRAEMANFNSELEKLEAGNIKVTTAGGNSAQSMRGGAAVSREYTTALRELIAAQKEMEKAVAKADEAMEATVAADQNAEAVKKQLTQAERELASVSNQLSATHKGMGGNIIVLSEKEDALKTKVAELQKAYEEAKASADKFNQKLEESSQKAGKAAAKYNDLKAKVESLPKPVAQVTGGVDDFSKRARMASRQATKMARGFNAVAFAAGASIPGLNKVGQVIGTFAYAGPVIGGIVVGVGALTAGIKFLWDESQRGYKLTHDLAVQAQKDVQETQESIAALAKEWNRLGKLESAGALTNEQNTEAARIIEHLTDVYGDLGLGIDKATRKLTGYSQARAEANEREREHEINMARSALKKATRDANNQREQYVKSATAKDFFDKLAGKSPEQIRMALEKRRAELRDVQANEKSFVRVNQEIGRKEKGDYNKTGGYWAMLAAYTLPGEHGVQSGKTRKFQSSLIRGGLATKEVNKELKLLGDGKEGLIAAYKAIENAKKNIAELETKDKRTFNIKQESLENRGLEIDEKGNARLLTDAEKYERKKERIKALEQDIAVEENKRGKGSPEYLRLEAERRELLYSTLQYEKKISQEKQRQAEHEQKAIERAELRRKAMLENYRLDVKKASIDKGKDLGGEQLKLIKEMIQMRADYKKKTGKDFDKDLKDKKLPEYLQVEFAKKRNRYFKLSAPKSDAAKYVKKDSIDKEKDWDSEQRRLVKEMNQMRADYKKKTGKDFDKDLKDKKLPGDLQAEFAKKQNRYTELSIKKSESREAREEAKKKYEAGRRNFVYDRNGNIVREKSEAELAKVRQQEIAAAREKVKQTSKGSSERYKAQAELDRLQQEDFRKRQEISLSDLGFSQKQAHNNMVQGIQVRSAQALRLETRNFSKPDNAWKTLEKNQVQIRDALFGFTPDIAAIAEANKGIREKLVNL